MSQFNPNTLTAEQWNHKTHILTAAFYCLEANSFFEALTKTKCFIIHFGANRGFDAEQCSTKYHETITCFWVEKVWNELKEKNLHSLELFIQHLEKNPQTFSQNILNEFYSEKELHSDEARATWLKKKSR